MQSRCSFDTFDTPFILIFFRFGAKVRKKFTLFYMCWAGRFLYTFLICINQLLFEQSFPPPKKKAAQSHNTKSLIHYPPKKRSHQGSAYPNIKHYRTIASLIHSTIYRTSSSVTYGPAGRQKPILKMAVSTSLV